MTISNLNSTPALHLNDVNQETVENIVAPESYSPCQETPQKVKDSPTVACSAVAFGKNIFDEFGITLMVSRILTHLQWKSTFAFFENSTGLLIFTLNYGNNEVTYIFFDSDKSYLKTTKIVLKHNCLTQRNPLNPKSPPTKKNPTKLNKTK